MRLDCVPTSSPTGELVAIYQTEFCLLFCATSPLLTPAPSANSLTYAGTYVYPRTIRRMNTNVHPCPCGQTHPGITLCNTSRVSQVHVGARIRQSGQQIHHLKGCLACTERNKPPCATCDIVESLILANLGENPDAVLSVQCVIVSSADSRAYNARTNEPLIIVYDRR